MKIIMEDGMIKTSLRNKFLFSLLCAGVLIMNFARGAVVMHDNIWSFIDSVRPALSVSADALQPLLPGPLNIYKENHYFSFYHSSEFTLLDGTKLKNLNLRVNKKENNKPFIFYVDVSDRCIKLEEVRKHYPSLVITETPQGHSSEDVTGYSSVPDEKGQVVTFSFAENKAECLSSVIIKN